MGLYGLFLVVLINITCLLNTVVSDVTHMSRSKLVVSYSLTVYSKCYFAYIFRVSMCIHVDSNLFFIADLFQSIALQYTACQLIAEGLED